MGYLGCLGASPDLPALDFVLSRREEVDQLHRLEAGGDDLRQGARRLMLQTQNIPTQYIPYTYRNSYTNSHMDTYTSTYTSSYMDTYTSTYKGSSANLQTSQESRNACVHVSCPCNPGFPNTVLSSRSHTYA